eukprot:8747616-Pyramimonas_sp.AAC.1
MPSNTDRATAPIKRPSLQNWVVQLAKSRSQFSRKPWPSVGRQPGTRPLQYHAKGRVSWSRQTMMSDAVTLRWHARIH